MTTKSSRPALHDSAELVRLLPAFVWVPLLMLSGLLDWAGHSARAAARERADPGRLA